MTRRGGLAVHNERVKLYATISSAVGLAFVGLDVARPLADGAVPVTPSVFLHLVAGIVMSRTQIVLRNGWRRTRRNRVRRRTDDRTTHPCGPRTGLLGWGPLLGAPVSEAPPARRSRTARSPGRVAQPTQAFRSSQPPSPSTRLLPRLAPLHPRKDGGGFSWRRHLGGKGRRDTGPYPIRRRLPRDRPPLWRPRGSGLLVRSRRAAPRPARRALRGRHLCRRRAGEPPDDAAPARPSQRLLGHLRRRPIRAAGVRGHGASPHPRDPAALRGDGSAPNRRSTTRPPILRQRGRFLFRVHGQDRPSAPVPASTCSGAGGSRRSHRFISVATGLRPASWPSPFSRPFGIRRPANGRPRCRASIRVSARDRLRRPGR